MKDEILKKIDEEITQLEEYRKDDDLSEFGMGMVSAFKKAKDIIKSTFDANNRWIPVEERLPAEAGNYIVTQYNEKFEIDPYVEPYRVLEIFFDGDWWEDIDNHFGWGTVAWQNLPAPYKKGE